MVYGFRRGLNRGGSGFGFRGASPPWPYIGRGRGGLPRCQYPGIIPSDLSYYPVQGVTQYSSGITREQELSYLKKEANFMRKHLADIEARMKDLQATES